jgi:predicted nucleotidyltransferase
MGQKPTKGGVCMAGDIETASVLARQYADDVRRELPVSRAVLFGSYAKGTASEVERYCY